MNPTIDPGSLLVPALLIMGGLAVVLAAIIYVISRRFHVEEDQRKVQVEGLLPGINCGACGYPGCSGMASALVEAADRGSIEGLICPPGGSATMSAIGELFGMAASSVERRVAVLRCGGSLAASPARTNYDGPRSCVVVHTLYAGPGACPSGCLREGDCVAVCQFNAIHLDSVTRLPVIDPEACTACEACVKACPRDLIRMHPWGSEGKRVWVNCRNTEKGAIARKNCSSACIACGKCVKTCDAIAGAITMDNNLAVIDPARCTACGACIDQCPTGAIVASLAVKGQGDAQ